MSSAEVFSESIVYKVAHAAAVDSGFYEGEVSPSQVLLHLRTYAPVGACLNGVNYWVEKEDGEYEDLYKVSSRGESKLYSHPSWLTAEESADDYLGDFHSEDQPYLGGSGFMVDESAERYFAEGREV